MMNLLLVVAHSLVCLVLIALVLMQQGKGADSAFGTGASSTVFGSKGSNSFIIKATALVAFVFFFTTTSLTYLTQYQAKHQSISSSIVGELKAHQTSSKHQKHSSKPNGDEKKVNHSPNKKSDK